MSDLLDDITTLNNMANIEETPSVVAVRSCLSRRMGPWLKRFLS